MNFDISILPNFERELKKLSKKYPSIKTDLSELAASLKKNPFQGDRLGKDCFKVRMKITSKGKGKSGGSRVITCVKVVDERVILISIYDKSEQSDITNNFLMHLLSENNLI